MKVKSLFSKEEINHTRQLELDAAKAFAVVFMVIVHVYEYMGVASNSIVSKMIELLGSAPAAGVFMVSMGIGMVYTKQDSSEVFAKRGLKLLLWGYILNFFRGTLILFVAKILGISNSYEDVSLFDSLMYVDILQFAGIAFLFTALLKKMHAKYWHYLLIAFILCLFSNTFVGVFENSASIIKYIMSLFVYIDGRCAFPFFSWYIYPVIGVCFGMLLKHVTDKNKFYLLIGVISAAVMALITSGCMLKEISVFNMLIKPDYYHPSLLTTVWLLSIAFLTIPLYYLLMKGIHGKAETLIRYVSSKVTRIYVLQWLVINYSVSVMEIFQAERLSALLCVGIGIVITLICIMISMALDKLKGKRVVK